MSNPRIKMISRYSKLLAAVLGLVTVWSFHVAAEAKGARWTTQHNGKRIRTAVKAQTLQHTLRRQKTVNHTHGSRLDSAFKRLDQSGKRTSGAPLTRVQIASLKTAGKQTAHTIPMDLMRRLSPKVRDVLSDISRTGKRGPATFDGDGTLWAGDVGLGFFAWMLRRGHYPRARQQGLKSAWKQYRKGTYDGEKFYELMVTSMAGMKESRVQKLAADYFRREHRKRIYRPMANMVTAMKRMGIDPWVVSGSPQWVVAAGAKYLGIPHKRVIGLSVKVDNHGRLTNQIVRPVPWKAGKAKRIMAEVGQIPIFAAGNSYGDIQMLRIASEPALVINPCPTTLQAAQNHGWTIHHYTRTDEVALRNTGLIRRLISTSSAGTNGP